MRMWTIFPLLYALCTLLPLFNGTEAWLPMLMGFQYLSLGFWVAIIVCKKEMNAGQGSQGGCLDSVLGGIEDTGN